MCSILLCLEKKISNRQLVSSHAEKKYHKMPVGTLHRKKIFVILTSSEKKQKTICMESKYNRRTEQGTGERICQVSIKVK